MGFEGVIEDIKEVDLNLEEYLKESLLSDNKKYCRGWDYLKVNITRELKDILMNKNYWSLAYNSQKEDYILNKLRVELDEDLKRQLESFVYIWNDIKRDFEKQQNENKLKEDLLKKGFIEQGVLDDEELKRLSGLKVKCVLDVSKIGLMGSFNKKEEIEGRFLWNEFNKSLMIIPKRYRTRGFIIRNRFYFKEIK